MRRGALKSDPRIARFFHDFVLAEGEVEYQDRDGTAVYTRFPIASDDLAGKANIAIWTTTPWPLPANLAIALDPKELYVVQEFILYCSSTDSLRRLPVFFAIAANFIVCVCYLLF